MGRLQKKHDAMKIHAYIVSHDGCSADDLRQLFPELTDGEFRGRMLIMFDLINNKELSKIYKTTPLTEGKTNECRRYSSKPWDENAKLNDRNIVLSAIVDYIRGHPGMDINAYSIKYGMGLSDSLVQIRAYLTILCRRGNISAHQRALVTAYKFEGRKI